MVALVALVVLVVLVEMVVVAAAVVAAVAVRAVGGTSGTHASLITPNTSLRILRDGTGTWGPEYNQLGAACGGLGG